MLVSTFGIICWAKLRLRSLPDQESKTVKNFLAIYLGSESSANHAKWETLDEATRQSREKAGMEGWMNWAKKNEAVIVDMGSPVGKTKQVNSAGIVDTSNMIAGYTIVRAESHEAAATLFINHPHFTIFPGDSVEIMEILSIPEM